MDLTTLDYFQFENLVCNRVPFFIVHEGIDFSELYNSVEVGTIQRTQLVVSFKEGPSQVLAALEMQKVPKDWPVLILTQSGDAAQDWVLAFEKAGYRNTYYVKGGWHEIKSKVPEFRESDSE